MQHMHTWAGCFCFTGQLHVFKCAPEASFKACMNLYRGTHSTHVQTLPALCGIMHTTLRIPL